VLRCHIAALEAIGGVPHEILYDRMKTAVIGEDADGLVVYNRSLLDLARHYGFQPKACRPYRPKTKGKVERPFRYIREDFSAAYSAISMISTFSSGAGSTPSPMPGSTRPRSASSTKPLPRKSRISNRCRSRPTERFSSSNGASHMRGW
jgi:hypothetical protein